MHEGRKYSLGFYEQMEDAALAYNQAAIELYGDYASLNVIAAELKEAA